MQEKQNKGEIYNLGIVWYNNDDDNDIVFKYSKDLASFQISDINIPLVAF